MGMGESTIRRIIREELNEMSVLMSEQERRGADWHAGNKEEFDVSSLRHFAHGGTEITITGQVFERKSLYGTYRLAASTSGRGYYVELYNLDGARGTANASAPWDAVNDAISDCYYNS